MSNYAITWAWQLKLDSAAKFVLMALADKADDENSCFPGQGLLAKMTGLSVRTVSRHLAELEALGYLIREQRRRPDGFRTSDRYYLQIGNYISPDKLSPDNGATSPDNDDNLTGHGDGVTQSRTLREPKGGARASATPAPPERPTRFCKNHPDGTVGACGGCGDARRAYKQWETDKHARMAVDATESSQRIRWIRAQPECAHGVAGGDVDRPGSGTPGCADCRSIKRHTHARTG